MIEVFDYCDYIYRNNDPLLYLIEVEQNDIVRNSYFNLNPTQQFVLENIIMNEKSMEEVSSFLHINSLKIEDILYESLLTLLFIFEEKYYRKNNKL